jgi:DNA repair ATPase RecN
MLESLGEDLVHVYGQHEHQDFLDPLRHIDILDSSGGILALRKEFRGHYEEWARASLELRDLTAKQEQRRERLIPAFNPGEIARAKLKPGGRGAGGERGRLQHSEKLRSIAELGRSLRREQSAVERLKSTLQRLRGAKLDPCLAVTAAVESRSSRQRT